MHILCSPDEREMSQATVHFQNLWGVIQHTKPFPPNGQRGCGSRTASTRGNLDGLDPPSRSARSHGPILTNLRFSRVIQIFKLQASRLRLPNFESPPGNFLTLETLRPLPFSVSPRAGGFSLSPLYLHFPAHTQCRLRQIASKRPTAPPDRDTS